MIYVIYVLFLPSISIEQWLENIVIKYNLNISDQHILSHIIQWMINKESINYKLSTINDDDENDTNNNDEESDEEDWGDWGGNNDESIIEHEKNINTLYEAYHI